jgi:hypothetical protein
MEQDIRINMVGYMKRNNFVIAFILLLIFPIFSFPVEAAAGNENFDAGTWMITKGLEGFVYSLGDAIYGVTGTAKTNRSETDKMVINLLAWNVDPYSIQEVRDWQDICAAGFMIIGISALIISFIVMQLDFHSIDDIIGEGYTHNKMIDTLLIIIVVPIISIFGVWIVLKINYIVSMFISNYMIMTIPSTADNFLIYFFMAISFIILSIVLFIRAIYIVVFAAISIVVGVLYGVRELKQMVTDYVSAFLSIVFLQPKLLLIMVFGLIVISKIPIVIIGLKAVAYLALTLYLGWVGYKAIAGNAITTIVKVAVFKKVL